MYRALDECKCYILFILIYCFSCLWNTNLFYVWRRLSSWTFVLLSIFLSRIFHLYFSAWNFYPCLLFWCTETRRFWPGISYLENHHLTYIWFILFGIAFLASDNSKLLRIDFLSFWTFWSFSRNLFYLTRASFVFAIIKLYRLFCSKPQNKHLIDS